MTTTAPVLADSPFDALPCPWLRLDGSGRIVDANRALARLLGTACEALTGTPLEAWLNMPSRVMLQSVVQPLLKLHGTVAELALTLQPAAGGDAVDVLCYGQREGAGTQGPVAMQLVPITQRRRIEAELLRVKRAADLGLDMIFQLELAAGGAVPLWRFPYVSEAVRRLFGSSPEAASRSAEPVFACLREDDRAALLAQLSQSAVAGGTVRALVRVQVPVRTPVPGGDASPAPGWYEFHAVPRQQGAGRTLWHGHVADVTERVAMQEALVQRQALERVAQARSEFIARVSHELRTPLNGILGFAQLMVGDTQQPLAAAQAERLSVILQSGRHLLGVVNELLQISRIEAGQLELALEPVRVDVALARVRLEMQQLADERGVVLVLAEATACGVQAEPQRLHQVLLNLVSNAIKYNRRDGRVMLRASSGGGEARIDVADTGPGLSAQQQAALFQPFNRLGAERGGEEGTGLGLVLCRHLVGLMGGRLLVDSTPGAGSTFSVCLPLAAPASAAPAGPERAPVALVRPPAARGRVLYVEDNPVNAVLMEAIVAQRPGVSLVVCSDGAAACRSVHEAVPTLLLLDMHLPDGSGLELLPRLRALPGMPGVPAVVVSASAGADAEAEARAAGFDGYWTKPLDLAATLAELDRWLGG